jgi:predicted dehydrogenase
MRKKLKFGVVGAGNVAQSYLQAVKASEEVELVAVADIRADAARAFSEKGRCLTYEHYEHMAQDCELDAVIVCTPPVTHPEISIHLLNRRIHVLCEKPLSIQLSHACEMFDAARKNGVHLTMATKFRYVDDVVHAKSMVSAGILGQLVLCENVFTSRVDMASRWNSRPEISGGGVLIDNGTHSVDLMRYFLGPLSEMHVLEGKRTQGLNVEETVSLFVRSTGSAIGTIDLSWSINKERSSYLDIYGSDGAISIGWKDSRYLDYSRKEWVVFGRGYDKIQAFGNQIADFARAIRGEQPILVSEEDALASVNIVGVAYEALHQNQWTPVTNHHDAFDCNERSVRSWASA